MVDDLLALELERLEAALWLERLAHKPVWEANPGVQMQAYESEADVLFYGGAAGGGKTDLAIGLSYMEHHRAVIFRRVYPNLREVIERSKALFDHVPGARYNDSKHRWHFPGGKVIEFESCQHEDDKTKQRGRPRDLYCFDEIPEFSKTQFEFITGWLRTTRPGQRTRIVCTFNPPMESEGTWVLEYIRPWLAFLHPEKFNHPRPAKPGELRWYATIAGQEVECDDGEPFMHDGERIEPLSRTFIPAKLEDNPHLADSGYRARLQALPEPLRSQLLYGDFGLDAIRDPWQVIPTDWIRQAQARWFEREKPVMPVSGVGVDIVRGGKDAFALAKRYGTYFDQVVTTPGVDVNDGPAAAQLMLEALRDEIAIGYINVDVIGVGSSAYDSAKVIWPRIVNDLNVARSSDYIALDVHGNEQFRMQNKRAEVWWRFREALDPVNGLGLALPPGDDVLNDLKSTRYSLLASAGRDKPPIVKIEPKEETKKRLGRSPDVGEAILYALNDQASEDYVVAVSY